MSGALQIILGKGKPPKGEESEGPEDSVCAALMDFEEAEGIEEKSAAFRRAVAACGESEE